MTWQSRQSSIRSRVAPLLFGSILALVAGVANAGPGDPMARTETVEEIWIDAAGTSGLVRTSPSRLDGVPGEAHFGPQSCGRKHRLGVETLRALHGALREAQPVRIDTAAFTAGEQTRQCITGVAFFAPIR